MVCMDFPIRQQKEFNVVFHQWSNVFASIP